MVGAGPDCLVIATTDSIRRAIGESAGEQTSKTKAFQPQATIPLPSRPTHVAFSASDDALMLAAEGGSQISVFETATLLQGNSQPALSVQTNGVSVRALAPNPDPSSTLAAIVTVNGELLVADLKAGSLIPGPNGPVLRNAVSCVAWSNKGKQLVAGLADGTADQMTPDGTSKAQIPRPSDLEGECHGELESDLPDSCRNAANYDFAVSSIAWLENDVFFMIYTPNGAEDEMGGNPPSHYYIITRRKQAPFLIQRMPEICNTMGFSIKRAPAFQFIARLRDCQPHLKDVLMVSSTLSTDVGLIAKSDKPLASDEAAQTLVGQYTVAEVNDDAKRAALPLTEDSEETSVIGLATDLTSRDNVTMPIAGEDIVESSTPLPGLLLLNNQGQLSSWWFVYSESVREKVPYPGLTSIGQAPQSQSQPKPPIAPSAPQQSTIGNAPSFGSPGFAKSGGSTFGGQSTMGATAFGKPSGPAFGSPGRLGGSTPAFGQPSAPGPSFGTSSLASGSSNPPGGPSPAFGQPSAPGPSFGSPSTPGSTFGSTNAAKPQFGQSGFSTAGSTLGKPSSSGKSLLGSGSGGGGFGSFSSGAGSGFSSFAAAKPGESAFSKTSGDNVFGKPSGPQGFGAQPQGDSPFAPKPNPIKNPFGKSTDGFVLGSSFKPDATAANDALKPDDSSSGAFGLGGSFDEMVSSSSKPSPPAESMDDGADVPGPAPPAKTEPISMFGAPSKPSTQPASLFGASSKSSTQPASLFGKPAQPANPPAETSKSPFSLFGNSSTATSTQSTQNQVTSPLSAPSDKTATPKREQSVSTPTFPSLEPPLPPDSTTRASYAAGDTSASSNVSKSSVEDAPLPPTFISSKSTPKDGDAPLPPDFLIKSKKAESPPPVPEDAPLPPDPTTTKVKVETPPAVPEDAPLPPDPTTTKVKVESPEEAPLPPDPSLIKDGSSIQAMPLPNESESEQDADESDFSDSGEEITHEETKIPSPKPSAESSFSGFSGLSTKSPTGGLFGGIQKKTAHQEQPPRSLFGEIPKKPVLPPPGPAAQTGREPYRSPSPIRATTQKGKMVSRRESRPEPGSTLNTRKASMVQQAQREGQLKKPSDAAREEHIRAQVTAQEQEEEEPLALSDDDEDERLRADLARPVEPVDTLDPFLPHQSYAGETPRAGIPGMIERLYRDINSMACTLGINARSLESYLLYQQGIQSADVGKLVRILQSENPASVLDEKLYLKDIGVLDDIVAALGRALDEQRLQGVEEKIEQCQRLLTKDIVTVRGQCASLRKTLDAHTDSAAVLAVPLSAEQSALQHDLRTALTEVQAKTAELEQGVALIRAQLADLPRTHGPSRQSKRPTMESVKSTIQKMRAMAEEKSIDMISLENKMKNLGMDTSGSPHATPAASPFTTPRKSIGGVPRSPGSRGSVDGSAYHTPESASRGLNFRASVNGSIRTSHLRNVEGATQDDSTSWRAKHLRRQQLIANLKKAIDKKPVKVRGIDDL